MSRRAEVPQGTEVTPQAPIVVNGVRDAAGSRKRKARAMRDAPFYGGAIDDSNLSIVPGQLVMLLRTDDVERTTFDDNYIVVGSANGLGEGLGPSNSRLTRVQKKARVRQDLEFGGVARGMVDASKNGKQGFAIQTGGTYTIVNTGFETLYPGDFLVWDVPEPEIGRNHHISGQSSFKMHWVVRTLQTELERAGVTAKLLTNRIVGSGDDALGVDDDDESASRLGEHEKAAASSMRTAILAQQVLAIERYGQAKELVGKNDNVLSDEEREVKADFLGAIINNRTIGDAAMPIRDACQVIAGLTGLTRDDDRIKPSAAVMRWFARFALNAEDRSANAQSSIGFPGGEMPGTGAQRDDWRGDMLMHQQNWLANLLRAIGFSEHDIRRRIFGRATSFGEPGQYVDVQLAVRA